MNPESRTERRVAITIGTPTAWDLGNAEPTCYKRIIMSISACSNGLLILRYSLFVSFIAHLLPSLKIHASNEPNLYYGPPTPVYTAWLCQLQESTSLKLKRVIIGIHMVCCHQYWIISSQLHSAHSLGGLSAMRGQFGHEAIGRTERQSSPSDRSSPGAELGARPLLLSETDRQFCASIFAFEASYLGK